jgi:hypothetical protein
VSDLTCAECGKTFKTRSGLWKHSKKHEPSYDDDEPIVVEEQTDEVAADDSSNSSFSDEGSTSTPSSTSSKWQSFSLDIDDEVTETMPTPLKMVARQTQQKSGSKKTKAQLEAEGKLNVQLLKSGLGIIDGVLTKYGRAVTLDEEYAVKHSDADKTMVAEAQWRYLESKGVIPSMVINEGVLAAGMTAWYVGSPLMDIRKKSKRSLGLLKGGSKVAGGLRRLPLIGRLFGRRKKNAEELFQPTLDDYEVKNDD